MKQFKYTINGNLYNVTVNKVEDTIAEVEVNGIPYKVLMDKPTKKQVITVKRPVQAVNFENARRGAPIRHNIGRGREIPAAGHYHQYRL